MRFEIDPIYDHFTGIGVDRKNDQHVRTDSGLVSKQWRVIRLLQNVVAWIFCFPNTRLSNVINAVRLAANRTSDPEQAQRAAFIICVLQRLERGSDPHLDSLARLNRLSNRIATSQLTAAQKDTATDRLREIKTQYEQGKKIAQALKKAEKEIFSPSRQEPAGNPVPLNPIRVSPSLVQEELNQQLIRSVKGVKNGVALLASVFFSPLAGLLVAAYTPPEGNKDLTNIDNCLAQGANINHQDVFGYTALIYASYYGYPQIAAHLLARGASVEIKEDQGYNAYTMAQYYVNDYTERLQKNDGQHGMREHYLEIIARYQQIVDMLKPRTQDRQMPRSSWW